MGDFKSGIWISVLLIYFFGFFMLIFSVVNAANATEDATGIKSDTNGIYVVDPGFQTRTNPFNNTGSCGGGTSDAMRFCEFSKADTNTTCSYIPGCEWQYDADESKNTCQGSPDLGTIFTPDCEDVGDDQVLCSLLRCAWISMNTQAPDSVNLADTADFSAVKTTVAVMVGFDAGMGIPAAFQFIIGFLFFWIPFVMLLWSIYMALPWLHG